MRPLLRKRKQSDAKLACDIFIRCEPDQDNILVCATATHLSLCSTTPGRTGQKDRSRRAKENRELRKSIIKAQL